ncbi:MAG TPA: polysaccharide deacetylase family protein [Stellaceae bacterium]|nr:polysaccharide deacetylase family protein [Stellaceae bacterium]
MDEFDRWAEWGLEATLWWRDDDAVAPNPRLERLLAVAGAVPVALAVIPGVAEAALERVAAARRGVFFLQHGWKHVNHAPAGEKKSEFPPARPAGEASADLARGRERLGALFGTRALAVLVPPWNRLAATLVPLLPDCGIAGLSRAQARPHARPAPGLRESNIHVDLVAWAKGRGFLGEAAALSGLVGHLRARREGRVDRAEPTGILTHHLVAEDRCEAFLRRLLAVSLEHRGARWLCGPEVFSGAPVPA